MVIAGFFLVGFLKRDKLTSFLITSHPKKANTILIEGWLPHYAVDSAKKEINKQSYDLIILTGLKDYGLEYCTVGMNGYFIFYPGTKLKNQKSIGEHLIEIDAYSEMDGKYQTHINFYINDSLITDFNIRKKKQKYPIKWHGSLASIDSMIIEFTNDMVDESGDRNLYIKEVVINRKSRIHYRHNSVYDVGLLDGKNRIPSDYDSGPEIKRRDLISYGIDSSKIKVITAEKTGVNRTLASALAVLKWVKSSQYQINGLNIISLGIHSRRTWLTYKRLLPDSIEIGIIPINEIPPATYNKKAKLSLLKETLGFLYYWIILIPFVIT